MPVEAKPLFRPDALRPHLKAFQLPRPVEHYQAILGKWAGMLSSGKADRFKEQEILPDFLSDVLCGVLDYVRPADNPERQGYPENCARGMMDENCHRISG